MMTSVWKSALLFQIIPCIWDTKYGIAGVRFEIKVDLRKRRIVLYARRQDSDEGWNVGEKGEAEGGAFLPGHSHFFLFLFPLRFLLSVLPLNLLFLLDPLLK